MKFPSWSGPTKKPAIEVAEVRLSEEDTMHCALKVQRVRGHIQWSAEVNWRVKMKAMIAVPNRVDESKIKTALLAILEAPLAFQIALVRSTRTTAAGQPTWEHILEYHDSLGEHTRQIITDPVVIAWGTNQIGDSEGKERSSQAWILKRVANVATDRSGKLLSEALEWVVCHAEDTSLRSSTVKLSRSGR